MALVVVASVVFYGVTLYVFFVPKEMDSAAQVSLPEDASYQEYQDYVSDTNKGIKNLLNGDQLKQITPSDYPSPDLDLPRNPNPFVRSM